MEANSVMLFQDVCYILNCILKISILAQIIIQLLVNWFLGPADGENEGDSFQKMLEPKVHNEMKKQDNVYLNIYLVLENNNTNCSYFVLVLRN